MNARFYLSLMLGAIFCLSTASAAEAPATRTVPPAVLHGILAAPNRLPVAGSGHADVTLVEFFDYNCPYCRKLDPELRSLIGADPKVRVVRKDFPIFGDASVYAAYCAFAAARLGQYAKAHDALIDSKRNLNSRQNVEAVLKEAGLNLKAIKADVARHQSEYDAVLASNRRETVQLGVKGTPVLIVGGELAINTPDSEQLQALVQKARAH